MKLDLSEDRKPCEARDNPLKKNYKSSIEYWVILPNKTSTAMLYDGMAAVPCTTQQNGPTIYLTLYW